MRNTIIKNDDERTMYVFKGRHYFGDDAICKYNPDFFGNKDLWDEAMFKENDQWFCIKSFSDRSNHSHHRVKQYTRKNGTKVNGYSRRAKKRGKR